MFRFLRRREGFTLIELMMVVAVIGILAAVLIPKIGGTKNEAKLAGMDTNVRVAQAAAEANIGRYQGSSATNAADFAARVASACNGVQNPFTPANVNGAAAAAANTAAISGLTPTTAVVAITTADVTAPVATAAGLAGTVIVTCTLSGTAIATAVISSYDHNGVPLPPVTVSR